jgi:hypothetical protein
VTKVHVEARKFAADGYTIVLVGHAGHEEVEGTMGEAPDHIILIESVQDVDQVDVRDSNKVAYISQTTLSVDETRAIIKRLRERGHDPGRARRARPLLLLSGSRPLRGADITVHASDQRRAPGHLSRRGSPALRWALFEAAQCARRPNSPDHANQQAAKRLGGNRARLSVARKLLKRSYHTLRELGEEALQPAGRSPTWTAIIDRDRPSGRTASPSGIIPSTIMSPTRDHPGSWTEIRLGARAHHNNRLDRAHAPPQRRRSSTNEPNSRLTSDACTDKERHPSIMAGVLQSVVPRLALHDGAC